MIRSDLVVLQDGCDAFEFLDAKCLVVKPFFGMFQLLQRTIILGDQNLDGQTEATLPGWPFEWILTVYF